MKKVTTNQSGQMLLEAILLMVIFMGIATSLTRFLKEKNVASNLVSKPWEKLAGMIECGTWKPCQGGKGLHPMTPDRILSLSPKDN